ncbi:DUF3262 family protein [Marinobacterium lutimaris]|uniref:Integrating conjugative element protein, PFL_4701 family n=1 Tax=Marinobacterium lutimaris TaxID=568106 RepID=A0A1H6DUX4_9GAMM|nr:DUF3262 family protein [Marinobacterium lutimaris]SEG89157.1 Protein of unknown function [Marinobacterium lutimaris]
MSWKTDFNTGASGFLTADDTLFAMQAIGATLILTWVAWVCVLAYKDYASEKIKGNQVIFLWFRAVFALSVILYLLVN